MPKKEKGGIAYGMRWLTAQGERRPEQYREKLKEYRKDTFKGALKRALKVNIMGTVTKLR